MKTILTTYPNRLFAAILSLAVLIACDDSDKDPKCYMDYEAWAMGVAHESHIKYIDVKPYDPAVAPGTEIKWLHLELDSTDDQHIHVGAVKFKELHPEEIPNGSAPGEHVKLMIRIDEPDWYFGRDTDNVKVQGYTTEPTNGEDIEPSGFTTFTGKVEAATGEDWEYFEVILPRFPFYSIFVGTKMEVPCNDAENVSEVQFVE